MPPSSHGVSYRALALIVAGVLGCCALWSWRAELVEKVSGWFASSPAPSASPVIVNAEPAHIIWEDHSHECEVTGLKGTTKARDIERWSDGRTRYHRYPAGNWMEEGNWPLVEFVAPIKEGAEAAMPVEAPPTAPAVSKPRKEK